MLLVWHWTWSGSSQFQHLVRSKSVTVSCCCGGLQFSDWCRQAVQIVVWSFRPSCPCGVLWRAGTSCIMVYCFQAYLCLHLADMGKLRVLRPLAWSPKQPWRKSSWVDLDHKAQEQANCQTCRCGLYNLGLPSLVELWCLHLQCLLRSRLKSTDTRGERNFCRKALCEPPWTDGKTHEDFGPECTVSRRWFAVEVCDSVVHSKLYAVTFLRV